MGGRDGGGKERIIWGGDLYHELKAARRKEVNV